MEDSMGKFSFKSGFSVFRKREPIKVDFSDLKAHDAEMRERIDQLERTLNGEKEWFLCLTKRKESCDDPTG